MSDPTLLTIDDGEGGLERWLFAHNLNHQALAAKVNELLPDADLRFYILNPLSGIFDDWLLDHQKAHDDLCEVTGVTGSDLTTVDFENPRQKENWLQINAIEHDVFAQVLKL